MFYVSHQLSPFLFSPLAAAVARNEEVIRGRGINANDVCTNPAIFQNGLNLGICLVAGDSIGLISEGVGVRSGAGIINPILT